MSKLKSDDYLVEVTMRVAVRRKDAPAVIALTRSWDQDETEEEKILSAMMDLADEGYTKHEPLFEYESSTARRLPTLKAFKDITTLGERPRLRKAPKPEIESPFG